MNMDICEICGRPAECTHHLIFGQDRKKADADGLTMRLCNNCHNMSKHCIHENPAAESLSKKLGELVWELNYLREKGINAETARRAFRERYGRNYW